MAEQEAGQNKERPVTGYYVFMGLVIAILVIIAGYVVYSYLVG